MAQTTAKTWDEGRLRQDRLESLQAEMRKSGVGALYLSDTANLQYIIGVRVRSSKAFVPADGKAIVFVRPRDIGYVGMHFENTRLPLQRSRSDPRPLGRFELPLEAIKDLMVEHGVSGGLLGLDLVEGGSLSSLSRSDLGVTDARPVLENARSVKTRDEVEIYRAIGQQLCLALGAFRDAIRPGVGEHDLASAVAGVWFGVGGEEIGEIEVCSGGRNNPWQRWPTDRTLREGDFVGIDFHARGAAGLIGDLSRTYLVGHHPTPDQSDLYRRACDYMLAVTAALRAGRTISQVLEDVPAVPENFSEQLGNYNIAHTVGMTWAGVPEINRGKNRDATVLQPNHVLTVESYFGEKGGPYAVKLERMLVVRDGEPEVLDSGLPLEDWLVP